MQLARFRVRNDMCVSPTGRVLYIANSHYFTSTNQSILNGISPIYGNYKPKSNISVLTLNLINRSSPLNVRITDIQATTEATIQIQEANFF